PRFDQISLDIARIAAKKLGREARTCRATGRSDAGAGMNMLNIDLQTALADAERRYTAANPASADRHNSAARHLPGGNTRAVMYYRPFPVTMVHGEGCRLRDLDGHEYTDFVSEYGAGLYGHSDPVIRRTLEEVLRNGWVLGAPNVH